MSDDKTIRDQIINAYLMRAAALIDESRELMEEVARFAVPGHGWVPIVEERTEQPEETEISSTEPGS